MLPEISAPIKGPALPRVYRKSLQFYPAAPIPVIAAPATSRTPAMEETLLLIDFLQIFHLHVSYMLGIMRPRDT